MIQNLKKSYLNKELEQAYHDYIDRLNDSHDYCRCPHSMIKCDNRGCRCQICGGHEKTLPDMDYITWLELRVKTGERKISNIQANLNEIKSWHEDARYLPGDSPNVPVKIWNLMQKLGDLFGNKN